MKIKMNSIKKNLSNIFGFRSNRRIIIFESDDWGSIRIPSRKVYETLLKAGLNLNGGDGELYSLFDSLETEADLGYLFQTLNSFKDINNSPPIFTAIGVVANPDFEKIKENGFRQYFYEPVTETCRKYTGCENTFKLWQEGIKSHVFIPQFHGREHLNVSVWMKVLRANDRETHLAFNAGMWAFIPKHTLAEGLEYEAAFQLSEISDLETHKNIIADGLDLFEKLFGYRAYYFVPPNGRINNTLNSTCIKNGIKFRSASKIQDESLGSDKTKRKLHWLGQKDKSGIRYITRNCFFEPSWRGKDWVDSCLNDIKIAFRWGKPAIISSHRINYIGAHDILNRENGLKELNRLLTAISKNWPEVEYFSK